MSSPSWRIGGGVEEQIRQEQLQSLKTNLIQLNHATDTASAREVNLCLRNRLTWLLLIVVAFAGYNFPTAPQYIDNDEHDLGEAKFPEACVHFSDRLTLFLLIHCWAVGTGG